MADAVFCLYSIFNELKAWCLVKQFLPEAHSVVAEIDTNQLQEEICTASLVQFFMSVEQYAIHRKCFQSLLS
jgi:hypothetical protein